MKNSSFLKHVAYQLRALSLKMTTHAGSGHATSALSAADIMAVLFFHTMRFDLQNYNNANNDRFILSKGHAAPVLYAVWHELGMISDKELMSYRAFGSPLEGHPTLRFAYAEAATGSLGIGLSIGLGEALAATMDARDYKTFVLMGDSEVSEGSVWEAAQLGAYYKSHNLIGIIDCNRLGQSTPTMQALEGNQAQRFKKMFSAFGWRCLVVDGHDIGALIETFDTATHEKEKPVMVIAQTKKGYGVDLFEDKEGFHGKALSEDELHKALEQLQARFATDAAYEKKESYRPKVPTKGPLVKECNTIKLPRVALKKDETIATRKAYGQSLVALGGVCDQIISLDAEVKNSTFAQLFEEQYPDRFVQCFIAEQNMVSMAVGFARRGKIPFVSTFASFLSRAHDQIRMAAIGQSPLRIVGSHAGVSIGQDGPSQMGLEDIAMMRALPESIVLYPCDAVSTYALIEQMANYHDGISYLRTTRMATPIIYDAQEKFPVGGCKVVRESDKDQLCVIGAGITLIEALKAYEQLQKENIAISVIDLYSIKPLDVQTVSRVAAASGKRIITVEDHYLEGGLGSAVVEAMCNKGFTIERLAVTGLPCSGKPEELLADAGINAQAIVNAVNQMVG